MRGAISSEAIDVEDVAPIVHLLGELAVATGDVASKKRFLISGLARLIDADVWAWALSRVDARAMAAIYWRIDGGSESESQRNIVMETNFSSDSSDMGKRLFLNLPRHRTQTRCQLMGDSEWYACGFFEKFRCRAALDDSLYTLYPLGDGATSSLSFHLRLGKIPFSDRERCIVHLVAGEIDWLHRSGSDVPGGEQVLPLPLRQRQVLLMLLSGDSRKQIASKLEISEHTVTDYMKSLHKHFNVSSRGELLSKFIAGGDYAH